MRGRAVGLMAILGTAALAGDAGGALKTSACLAGKPSPKVELAILQQGASVSVADGARAVTVEDDDGSPVVVCVDGALGAAASDGAATKRVVALGRGLAVMFPVEASALSPVPADAGGWKQLRRRVKEDAQQTGCLKRLPVGTLLFAAPDGAVVGRVVDGSVPYGKWDFVQTKTSGWALLRVNLGFGPFEVWIKDRPRDWCPP